MTSTIESLAPAHAVIKVTYTGEVTGAELRQTAGKVLRQARETGIWRVLTDCRGMTKAPGPIELLNLMDSAHDAHLDPTFRQALLWPEDDEARLGFDFWRTVETNQGLHARAFGDHDAALAWLGEP